jgi:hypothetical protein
VSGGPARPWHGRRRTRSHRAARSRRRREWRDRRWTERRVRQQRQASARPARAPLPERKRARRSAGWCERPNSVEACCLASVSGNSVLPRAEPVCAALHHCKANDPRVRGCRPAGWSQCVVTPLLVVGEKCAGRRRCGGKPCAMSSEPPSACTGNAKRLVASGLGADLAIVAHPRHQAVR